MSTDRRAHTAPLFHELKILRFEKIFIYCVQLFMYQFHHKCLPEIFQSFYQFNHEIHTRSTTSRDLLHVPRCSTSVRQKSIRFIGVNVYNFFFKKISLVSELSTYKLHVKSFLLSLDLPDVKNIHKSSIIR